MGRGKLGGTKAKIRGKVGSEIYQIKRADDGVLAQHVYKAPEARQYTNTEAQARARMIMGQIERMFHILPDVIKYAFATIPSGTLSFQHFSRINYDLLKADMEDNWEYNPNFDWRPKYQLSAPAGIWNLAQGTLPQIKPYAYSYQHGYNGYIAPQFRHVAESATLGDFLRLIGMRKNDELHIYFYRRWRDTADPEIGEMIVRIKDGADLDLKLSESFKRNFFVVDNPLYVGLAFEARFSVFVLRLGGNDIGRDYIHDCFALMVVRRDNGKVQFSTTQFTWCVPYNNADYTRNAPNNVFDTWL